MILTLVLGDFGLDRGLRLLITTVFDEKSLFFRSDVPLVDVDVEVLGACVGQHKHESEQYQGEVRLRG